MAMKRMGQKSFADMLQLDHASLEELDEIHELIDWNSIDVILSNMRNIDNRCTGLAIVTYV